MASFTQYLKKRWPLLLAALAVLLALGGYFYQKSKPVPITAYHLTRQNVIATLTITGEVQPHLSLDVSAPINVRIQEILVDTGDTVQAGQIVVRLKPEELKAQLTAAQAKLAQAQAALDNLLQGTRPEEIRRLQNTIRENAALIRQQEATLTSAQATLQEAKANQERYARLYKQGAVSQQENEEVDTRFQTSQSDLRRIQALIAIARSRQNQAKNQLQQAIAGPTAPEIRELQAARDAAASQFEEIQILIANRTLRSTMPGVVTDRLMAPGDVATPGKPILQIADRQTLEMIADVQESDLSRIQIGAESYIILDAMPDNPIKGKVTKIGSEVNPENGSVDVTVSFSPTHKHLQVMRLLSGMTADVNIITDRLANTLVVPSISIFEEKDHQYVYRFGPDNHIQRHPVKARRISMEDFQILSGLSPGDWIVLDAVKKDGAKDYLSDTPKTPVPPEIETETSAPDSPKKTGSP